MVNLSLRWRLAFSYLLVFGVGMGGSLVVGHTSRHHLFNREVTRLEATANTKAGANEGKCYARDDLLESFHSTNNTGTILALAFGVVSVGILSFWMTQMMSRPLKDIERRVGSFTKGDLTQRVSPSRISEINRLGLTFNQMAESLEGVERRRKELIGDLTHELRTPLTIIQGELEELKKSIPPASYTHLFRETKRLQRLVRDVQELSLVEAGYLPIHRELVSLHPVLESLIRRFSEQLPEEGLELKLEGSQELPKVRADLDRTEQILINLLGNAISYTEKGAITLRAIPDRANSRLWIEVSDTGIGIAPEDLPYIFERFWRGEKSRSRYSGGSGIGLAIARRLIELQGGTLEVESQLGVGSTFRLSLPLA